MNGLRHVRTAPRGGCHLGCANSGLRHAYCNMATTEMYSYRTRCPSAGMRWRAMTLLLCSLLACSEAMVVMQTGNFTLEFPSLPADFGAPIPPKGLTGLLLLADPQDACTELKPPQWPEAPWVALIARSQQKDGCTFDIKVAHAEAAGAVAAVVYDDVFEPLILMAKDSRHPDPFIPSTFVTQKSGILMKRLMVEGETVVTLTPLSEALWLSMVMSAVAGFLAVNVVLGALWIIRRQRGGSAGAPGRPAPRPGMTASEIRALPIMVYEEQAPGPGGAAASGTAGMSAWGGSGGGEEANEEGQQQAPLQGGSDSGSDSGRHGGGTRHVCTICLENYIAGEKLRVLPCQHRYHVGCVDQWLSTRRPVCPVCKQGAHVPSSPPEYESEGEEAGPSGGRQQAEDLEAGHVPAQRQQRLRRRRRRHRATSFLLGRLGTGWAVLRRQLLGVPAGEGGASAARGGGGSGGGEPQEEQQQQLLAGSRTSSPIPAGTGAGGVAGVQQEQPESAATLTNFPAFFPALSSTSSGGRGVHSEIVPAEGTEVEAEAEARGTTVAAVFAAAPSTELPAGRRRSQHWRTGGSGAAFTSDSVASSPCGGPHSHLVQVQPDSTEGSETESELE